ncbi:MAG: hypothetical protein IPJ34_05610 [Myxococcales bacterium]|nr:hypothetical protein [Myxococcales bacterium]
MGDSLRHDGWNHDISLGEICRGAEEAESEEKDEIEASHTIDACSTPNAMDDGASLSRAGGRTSAVGTFGAVRLAAQAGYRGSRSDGARNNDSSLAEADIDWNVIGFETAFAPTPDAGAAAGGMRHAALRDDCSGAVLATRDGDGGRVRLSAVGVGGSPTLAFWPETDSPSDRVDQAFGPTETDEMRTPDAAGLARAGRTSLGHVGDPLGVEQPRDWWTRLFDETRLAPQSLSDTLGRPVSARGLSIVPPSDHARHEPVSIRSFDTDSLPPNFFLYVYVSSPEDADRFLRLGYAPTRVVGWLWERTADTPPGPVGALYRFFAAGSFLYTAEWGAARYFEKSGLRSQLAFGEAPRFMLPPQALYSTRKTLELTELFVNVFRGGLSTVLMDWTETVKWRDQLSLEVRLGWILKSWQPRTQPLIEFRRLRPSLSVDDGYIGGGGFDLHGAVSSIWRKFVAWYLETLAKKSDKLTEAMLADRLAGSWYPTPDREDLQDHVEDIIKALYERYQKRLAGET